MKKCLSLFTALVLVACLLPTSVFAASIWQHNSSGWWYQYEDGSYPYSEWKYIDGSWYHFNERGYMETGWQWIDGTWYHLAPSGHMETGWQWIDGTWYYFASSGRMETGWQWIDGTWYYFASSGRMETGWQWIDGTWYYFASSGRMETGWQYIGGTWYYLTSSGSMVTGWKWINGDCYYFYSNGAMAADTWIDGSYVNGSGKWDNSGGSSNKPVTPPVTEPPATKPPVTEPPHVCDYTTVISSTSGTCVVKGTVTKQCSCGKTHTYDAEYGDHNWEPNYEEVKKPVYKGVYVCKKCGAEFDDIHDCVDHCLDCDSTYTVKEYIDHYETETVQKGHKCTICGTHKDD